MLVSPSKIESLLAYARNPKNNIHIKDVQKVTEKLMKMNEKRAEHIHIISDFDMTLTKYWVDGKRNLSTHGVIEHGTVLSQEAKEKLHGLYATYYPIEISHEITKEDKFKAMTEWWTKAHDIIVGEKVSKDEISKMVSETNIVFRPLLKEFIAMATMRKIPLLVFSAGIADLIKEILLKDPGYWTEDMAIVSNVMKFDENGICVGFEDPLIHVMNKNEAGLPEKVHYEKVVNRDNVILMGDHLGDLQMGDGIRHDVKLTIGFLNNDIDRQLDLYANSFDIVITNDASLEYVILILAAFS
jgi:5'-nucleotidase